MYCLDTNIIIDIFHGNKEIVKKLNELKDDFDIYLTPVTLCELYKGAYLFFNQKKGVDEVDNFISSFDILDFNVECCREFGKIYAELKKKGKITQETDLMIASIAKVNDLILITRDKKGFAHAGVKLEVW